MKYRNGTVLVEAVQYKRGRALAVFDVVGSSGFNCDENGRLRYISSTYEFPEIFTNWDIKEYIMNSHGWVANPNDWIIRSADGEISRCEPEIFAATYEPILE